MSMSAVTSSARTVPVSRLIRSSFAGAICVLIRIRSRCRIGLESLFGGGRHPAIMVNDAAGRADQGPETALRSAAELSLGGPRLRQECWDEIAAPVRERLNELAGPVLYWWGAPVGHDDAAPKTVVFGERGLYFAEPQVESGSPPLPALEYRISGYDIVDGSMTVDDVEHTPAADDAPPSAAVSRGTESVLGFGNVGERAIESGIAAVADLLA